MDAEELACLGSELMDFLAWFDDCFGRSEPREAIWRATCWLISTTET